MENLVYIVKMGTMGFENSRHVVNFSNYLFSCSKAHFLNEDTHLNFYLKKDAETNKLNRIGFLINHENKKDLFLKTFKSDLKKDASLDNDLFYVFFFIRKDVFFVTNMFDNETNFQQMEVNLSEQAVGRVVDNFYGGSLDKFNEHLGGYIHNLKISPLKFKCFKSLAIEERKEIELFIHQKIAEDYPSKNVLIQVSHHDQKDHDLFHIHRLKYKDEG